MNAIPKLTSETTPIEARAYLIWLAGSEKYYYHIDDDPIDYTFGDPDITLEEKQQLSENREFLHEALEKAYGPDYWGLAWDIFGTLLDARELLKESFNDLCDIREYGYKATRTCLAIVDGAGNQTPESKVLTAKLLREESEKY